MDANKLTEQWRNLAERFRRIAGNNCSETDVRAAAAHGGRLAYEMQAAGLLSFIELPPTTPRSLLSDDDSFDMSCIWDTVANMFPGNPSHIQWKRGEGPVVMRVGNISPAHWRIRAENFAAVCDWLANECAASDDPPDGPTGMPWGEVANRLERLRQQGEPFTSQPKLAGRLGCSAATIHKAIKNTPSLCAWAKVDAAPKAQRCVNVLCLCV